MNLDCRQFIDCHSALVLEQTKAYSHQHHLTMASSDGKIVNVPIVNLVTVLE